MSFTHVEIRDLYRQYEQAMSNLKRKDLGAHFTFKSIQIRFLKHINMLFLTTELC